MRSAIISIVVLLAVVANGQKKKNSLSADGDIVETMMPNGVPTQVILPTAAERSATVKRLKAAQVQAKGKRAQQVAFLLARLGSEYDKNRDYLVKALHGCEPRPVLLDCDEDTAAFVIALYEHGDKKLLEPLLKAGLKSDGALSEILGSFYSDTLTRGPTKFLHGIQLFAASNQDVLCHLAGTTDGGGMMPDALRKARRNLNTIGGELAFRCLRQIEAANRPQ